MEGNSVYVLHIVIFLFSRIPLIIAVGIIINRGTRRVVEGVRTIGSVAVAIGVGRDPEEEEGVIIVVTGDSIVTSHCRALSVWSGVDSGNELMVFLMLNDFECSSLRGFLQVSSVLSEGSIVNSKC